MTLVRDSRPHGIHRRHQECGPQGAVLSPGRRETAASTNRCICPLAFRLFQLKHRRQRSKKSPDCTNRRGAHATCDNGARLVQRQSPETHPCRAFRSCRPTRRCASRDAFPPSDLPRGRASPAPAATEHSMSSRLTKCWLRMDPARSHHAPRSLHPAARQARTSPCGRFAIRHRPPISRVPPKHPSVRTDTEGFT